MDTFKYGSLVLLMLFHSIDIISATCVIETDFGFTFNCNFKKSNLFRVRNLGGVKSYISVGLSLGDELGFPESLSNLEGNRRRALNLNTAGKPVRQKSSSEVTEVQLSRPKAITSADQVELTDEQNFLQKSVPEFKPLPARDAIASREIDDIVNSKENSSSSSSESESREIDATSAKANEVNSTIIDLLAPRNRLPQSDKPRKPIRTIKRHHVMNAPKEYYPANYDKNFDDNFKSKIDLPITGFHCGDQKHFPGLYSDTELNCMVFHVCALTDEGLIMKSFLCPESTIFDQSILKCNWWFYTDCKNSKSLYDSNLPVAKSYQLMKSLFYFNTHYGNKGSKEDKNKVTIDQVARHLNFTKSAEV